MPLRALKAMYHSKVRVNELRRTHSEKTGITYDRVITLRPDILPLSILKLEEFDKEFRFSPRTFIHFFSGGEHLNTQDRKRIYTPLAMDLFVTVQQGRLTL